MDLTVEPPIKFTEPLCILDCPPLMKIFRSKQACGATSSQHLVLCGSIAITTLRERKIKIRYQGETNGERHVFCF